MTYEDGAGSEMSAHEIQMPGNYQKKEYSRIKNVFFFFI
jgi:hypothetical protein